ncbi:MAG: ThuA domain-containing protein, partial [Polyangiales bacterium]
QGERAGGSPRDAAPAVLRDAATPGEAVSDAATRFDAAARGDGSAPNDTAPRRDAAAASDAAARGDAAAERDAATRLDAAAVSDAAPRADAAALAVLRFTVFSRTQGFRHDAIEPAQAALSDIAQQLGAAIALTEDSGVLTAMLPQTDVVVFLMTTGDVLDDTQQAAFEAFIRAGGGFLGVHSSADTEYNWPFYETLNGAWFDSHPAIQPARLQLQAAEHPTVSFLPAVWQRTDEWYNFRENPRGAVDVLVTIDETSYEGGTHGEDHPVIWCHRIGAGRAFYTALGHTQESWREPLFLQHIEAALGWAAGR